jgi:ADP-ribosylation factor GTPase-activating protein 1
MPTRSDSAGGIPGVDEFQKDPVAALTKGFGWFTTAVGKGAKTVNDSYIQPAAKTVMLSTLTLTPHIDYPDFLHG